MVDAPVPEVVEQLLRGGASKAVVLDRDQKPLGIITLIDLLVAKGWAQRRGLDFFPLIKGILLMPRY